MLGVLYGILYLLTWKVDEVVLFVSKEENAETITRAKWHCVFLCERICAITAGCCLSFQVSSCCLISQITLSGRQERPLLPL